MNTLASVGLLPIQGIIMCAAFATAFVLLCAALATHSRLVRVLSFAGFSIELLCAASLLIALAIGGVRP